MRPARIVALAVGALAIVWLLRFLPAGVFAATQAFLFVAASLILLLVAAALVLRPVRALERDLFGLPVRAAGPLVGLPPEREMRAVLSPLIAAGLCAGIAALAGLVR